MGWKHVSNLKWSTPILYTDEQKNVYIDAQNYSMLKYIIVHFPLDKIAVLVVWILDSDNIKAYPVTRDQQCQSWYFECRLVYIGKYVIYSVL
jgi:hypothetical protein